MHVTMQPDWEYQQNADFSTALKCLESGKKSIEQLRPTVPR